MFNRKLKKRIVELENFLGIIHNTDEEGYTGYYYKVPEYGQMLPTGELGELKADLVKRQKEEQLTKKGKE